jgi:acyl-CoA synthetase (AMP-forming)/AMP-acid ligase II
VQRQWLNGIDGIRRALDGAASVQGALIAAAAADDGARRVVFTPRDGGEQRTSLAALLDRARGRTVDLAAHGVGTGDAVVLILPTGPELVESYLAALLLGAIPALASTPTQRVRDPEVYRALLAGMVCDARARLIVCDARTAALLDPERAASFSDARVVAGLDAGAERFVGRVPDDPDAIATIQYSSGSTGRPKGARLSHRAILNNVRAVRDALALGPDDVSVNWIPLYHDMGLIDALLVPLLCGCETVLLPTGDFVREPRLWLDALTRHRGTISWAPNFAYALCVQRIGADTLDGLDLSRWRLAINAAEPVLPETVTAFSAHFAAVGFRPEAMTPAWGLAENVTIATAHPPAAAPRVERIDRAAASAGHAQPVGEDEPGFGCVAVGRALSGCAIEIRDGARRLGERAIGDVWLASDSLFAGYGEKDPVPDSDAAPRWLATGDRGYLADGDLFFVARARDVIVIAGEKHAPHDVETAINAVSGVRPGCAVAFGIRDPTRGTDVLAAVVETYVEDPHARAALERAIRGAVTRVTGLALRHLKLVAPGGIHKTTSGKLARAATRAAHPSGLA